MSEQFKNFKSFKAYQKQIFDYINRNLIALPLFFENQANINFLDLTGANFQKDGGAFQKTTREGTLKKGRTIGDPLIAFDDAYAENIEDLSVIEYIAKQLNGELPSSTNLVIDAYLYAGADDFKGPIATDERFYKDSVDYIPDTLNYYEYIPYVEIKKYTTGNEKLLINFNTSGYIGDIVDRYNKYLADQGANAFITKADMESYLTNFNFNLRVQNYNLSDNTGNFLPVGVKKRKISKKLLKDSSETEITEIIPETDEAKINRFFDGWSKTKDIIPPGTANVVGQNFIKNGDFAGGTPPGERQIIWSHKPDTGEINTNYVSDLIAGGSTNWFTNLYSQYGDDAFFAIINELLTPWDPIAANQIEYAQASIRSLETDNPGFSPFALATDRTAPAWMQITIDDTAEFGSAFYPGLDYTFSAWTATDDAFNPNNEISLNPKYMFFHKIVLVQSIEQSIGQAEIILKDWSPTLADMEGEPVQTWQGDLTWTRYRKIITIPSDATQPGIPAYEDGTAISQELQDAGYNKYRIYWRLGYQNSVREFYDASADSNLLPGPNIYTNGTKANQYFTGVRFNSGAGITSLDRVSLETIEPNSITEVLRDCLTILEPYKNDIPVYSEKRIGDLLTSNRNSSIQIIPLLTEIREGLIKAISDLTNGISETYAGFVDLIANNPESPLDESDLINLRDDMEQMIQGLAINGDTSNPNSLAAFNDKMNQLFLLFTRAAAPEIILSTSTTMTIQQLFPYQDEKLEYEVQNGVFYSDVTNPAYYNPKLDYRMTDTKPVWNLNNQVFDDQFAAYAGNPNASVNNVSKFTLENFNDDSLRTPRYISDMGDVYINFIPDYLDQESDNFEGEATPIAAMYESEMYTLGEAFQGWINGEGGVAEDHDFQISQSPEKMGGYSRLSNIWSPSDIAKGNPMWTQGYPVSGYGPVAWDGWYTFGTNSLPNFYKYGVNGVERIKEVAREYAFNLKTYTNQNILQYDEAKQFEGMIDDAGNALNNGAINGNFEELRTYVYKTSNILDYAKWIGEQISGGQPMTQYYNNIDLGMAQYFISGIDIFGRIMGTRINIVHASRYSTQQNLYRFSEFAAYDSGGIPSGDTSPIATRCYEPHWEWNPQMEKWIFRLAQPVIGIDAETYDDSGNAPYNGTSELRYPKYTNEDMENMELFEKKYKFKTLHLLETQGR